MAFVTVFSVMILIVVAVIAVFSTVIIVAMTFAVRLPVFRDVLVVVLIVLHKVDRPPAGVVLAAVFAPMLLMPRGNMEINRRRRHADGNRLNNDWLRKDQLRRPGKTGDFDVAVEARLSNTDRHSRVGVKCQA
jgi:hypothetical protein